MLLLPEQNVHWLMAVILQLMQLPPPPGALALSSEQPSCSQSCCIQAASQPGHGAVILRLVLLPLRSSESVYKQPSGGFS